MTRTVTVAQWPFRPEPHNPEAHIITNIGEFAMCRRDNFCRCRKCKPPLTNKGK